MVLEHLFPESWLEQKARYGFLLGAGYTVFGLVIAQLLFPADPALVAVAVTSMMLLPELYKIFSIEERQERSEKRFKLWKLISDNFDFMKVYLFILLGVFVVYALAAIMLPSLQVNDLFREQLEMRGASGKAILSSSSAGLFESIFFNNLWVLIACFLISLLAGDGAIFLLVWNASVWGTIFGVMARNAAYYAHTNPFYYLGLILLIVLPHAILEIFSYILAAISGGVISKDVLLEKFESVRFNQVFAYNFILFLIALLVLVVGAGVETWVLENIKTYAEIIAQSYAAG
ncbi:MAG TPA: stage II sporulation protein M [Candidatus Nanoarchaeia archaeon]|nr:stage II sporulation protein M [Candidatus Nanoarchaeia archaeon]